MARRFFGERQYKDKMGFRWRGGEVSRIEGFSDAVFAFSVTLLIVSLEVPHTFGDLLETMQGFVAFAASFAILIWLWHVHYLFFRRFGLQDAFTKSVNAVLLFVVLFYVYPLKFVFSNVIHMMSGGRNETLLPDGTTVPILTPGESGTMMIVYGLGFIAVFLCYVLFYWNALRKSEELRLTPLEAYATKMYLRQYFLCSLIGVGSVGLAWWGGDTYAAWAGFLYILLGPVLGIHGYFSGKRWSILNAQAPAQQFQQQRPQQFQGRPGGQNQRQQQRQQQGQGHRGGQRHQGQNRPQGNRPQGPRPQGPPPREDGPRDGGEERNRP